MAVLWILYEKLGIFEISSYHISETRSDTNDISYIRASQLTIMPYAESDIERSTIRSIAMLKAIFLPIFAILNLFSISYSFGASFGARHLFNVRVKIMDSCYFGRLWCYVLNTTLLCDSLVDQVAHLEVASRGLFVCGYCYWLSFIRFIIPFTSWASFCSVVTYSHYFVGGYILGKVFELRAFFCSGDGNRKQNTL